MARVSSRMLYNPTDQPWSSPEVEAKLKGCPIHTFYFH